MPSAEEIRDVQRANWAGLSAGWEKWDSVIMEQLGPVGTAIIERLDITEDHQHLDIAAGTGEPGLSIARLAPRGRVVLTDLAAEMLEVAARRARAQGVANIETAVCSADDLPFSDATFDSVSVRFGYMFFPDLGKATAEFARVLKPGGRLCSSVWIKPEANPWTSIAMQAIATEAVVAPPDPDGPNMFRCTGPGMCQCPVRGRRTAATLPSGTSTSNSPDAIARAVLGDDQRARLARSGGASAGRRTGAGADSGERHREGDRVREGRQGPGSGRGALHRGNETHQPSDQREERADEEPVTPRTDGDRGSGVKITGIEVIPFETSAPRISFGEVLADHMVVQTVTKVSTDEGPEGYYFGGHFHGDQDGFLPGDQALIARFLGPLLAGNDPFDREMIWQQLWAAKLPENVCSVIDLALWDLAGRVAGLPVHKLLGARARR